MAAVELDPQFIKALRLLRSKSKDSGPQLRAMLEEAIRQKRGLSSGSSGGPRSPSIGKQSRSVSSDRSDRDKLEKEKKKDLDRLKKDLSVLEERQPEAKRSRLDSPALSSSSHTPSPTPPPSRGDVNDVDLSDPGSDDEYADLDFNDCSCCVCKNFTQESGNKLMECSSCQNLYHQECHVPPVSNEKASDPRLIWNCDKCSNKGKSFDSKGSSVKDDRKYEKDKSKSSGSSSRSGSSSSSSKHKPSPAKSDSRGSSGPPVLSLSSMSSGTSSKIKTGGGSSSSSVSASSSQGPGDLSSTAKKRMKLIKQQAADMSSISKKKSAK